MGCRDAKNLAHNARQFAANDPRFQSIIETLEQTREKEGQEFWFPLAFDRPYSLIDYLDEDTMLLIVARERIESIAETIRKEYATMYRLALRDTLVPPPALISLSCVDLITKAQCALLLCTKRN